jgi:hypothetical protein
MTIDLGKRKRKREGGLFDIGLLLAIGDKKLAIA